MKAYLDTSSLIKLYHNEVDSEKIFNAIINVEELYLSEIAILEFCSAIWKKVREGTLREKLAIEVIQCFEDDYENFEWIQINSKIIENAFNLIMKYGDKGLRTLDSIQLASAKELKNENCIFLTSDKLLETLFIEEELKIIQNTN